MNNSKRKTDIFYFIVLILTMIIMLVGATFTYFSLLAKEKDDNTRIQTGILSINYIDGSEINAYALLPINEPNLDTIYSVYKKKFSISSDGTLDQNVNIYIDVTKNEFQDTSLKYSLYDQNNKKISSGNIPSEGRFLIASNIYLKSKQKKDYTVLIWLQENNQNQDVEQTKKFSGGFFITADQIKYE